MQITASTNQRCHGSVLYISKQVNKIEKIAEREGGRLFDGSGEQVEVEQQHCLSFQMVRLSLSGEAKRDRQPGEVQTPDSWSTSSLSQRQLLFISPLRLRAGRWSELFKPGGTAAGSDARCPLRLRRNGTTALKSPADDVGKQSTRVGVKDSKKTWLREHETPRYERVSQ